MSDEPVLPSGGGVPGEQARHPDTRTRQHRVARVVADFLLLVRPEGLISWCSFPDGEIVLFAAGYHTVRAARMPLEAVRCIGAW